MAEASLCSLDPLAACSGFSSTRGSRTLLVAAAPQSRWQAEQATQAPRNTKKTPTRTLFIAPQASAMSLSSPHAALISTRLTCGLGTRSSARCSQFVVASRLRRRRRELGLLCVLHRSPSGCCVIARIVLSHCVATNRDSCEHISTDSLES